MLEELFGNQALVAILHHLNHQKSVCASSLARELLYPVNMVQKQLNRLEKGKWVTPVFEGNKKVYYWNHANPLVKNLKKFLKETLVIKKLAHNIQEDAAYGLNLPLKERVKLCEELTQEGEFLNPYSRPKPFVKTFDSQKHYENWKKEQKNPSYF